jgi:hypothetical protein
VFVVLAFVVLVGGCGLALMLPRFEVALAAAGFAGYVLCGRRAMILWRADEIVFDDPRKFPYRQGHTPVRLLTVGLFLAALAASALAQQTIFNVPSADVLEKGKTYFEEDTLWRPREPNFAVFTGRAVYGIVPNVEAGVNFGGFVSPGRSVPVATPNVKWQPWHDDKLAVTAGVSGLFFLRGREDGKPAAEGYAHVAYKLPTNTRLTAGGYWASSGYAAADPQAGALLAFEQKVNDHLILIADWFSGRNGLGYLTPGISSTWGGWTLYAGYSFKNGDSKGNAMLFELGFLF